MRKAKYIRMSGAFSLVGLALTSTFLLTGCNARPAHLAGGRAPILQDGPLLRTVGGTNPNAPFAMPGNGPRLARREPSLVDVNAAEPCTAAQLSLFESGAKVDGARRSVRLNLVNTAKTPCRLSGFPSVSLLHVDGSLIGSIAIDKIRGLTLDAALHLDVNQASSENEHGSPTQPSPLVLLVPAGEATFEIGWTSGPDCDQVGSIAIAAPGTVRSFTVHHELTVCGGQVQVTSLRDSSEL